MKLSLNWIKEYVNLEGISEEDITTKINASICETEEVFPYLPFLERVVPAEILSISPHPQADKLRITQVNLGESQLQIVTNSTTVSVGDVVPCALPGAVISGITIQSSELRGVPSGGMFCSGKDIGITEDDSGVFILNDKNLPLHTIQGSRGNLLNIENEAFVLGEPISWQIGFRDTLIDIDNKSITHRPDLWSHYGFARELSAQFKRDMIPSPLDIPIEDSEFQESVGKIQVIVNDHAKSYQSLPISQVKVSGSTMKFRSRLIKSGMKSISNVVDVSNYILLDFGQPTHFFDRSKLRSDKLLVTKAIDGETLLLLDDTTPKLSEDILVIRNGDDPVAIAGVMGGKESAVFSETTELVLESAIFQREDIRKSIRRTGIRSDSSIRYEKGLDTSTCIPVIHRAIRLLRENGNPDIKPGIINGFDHEIDKKIVIRTDLSFLRRKIGKELSSELVEDILNRLGFRIIEKSESPEKLVEWSVQVPRYRHNYDVTIPEDLVEEIGRTIGYASVATIPLSLSLETPITNPLRELEKRLRVLLSAQYGFHEVFNYSFQSPEEARFEKDLKDSEIVLLKNEMPHEHSVLRTSIYPSLLKNAYTNQDRFEEFGIYEIGRTYDNSTRDSDGLPREWRTLGILYMPAGRTQSETRTDMERNFLDFRVKLERLLAGFYISDYEWSPQSKRYFHPNANLDLQFRGQSLGELGILHNREADRIDLRKRPILFRLDLEKLLEILGQSKKTSFFRPPSQFPQSTLDISLVLDENYPSIDYAKKVKDFKIPEMEEIWVHDTFRGGNLGEGKVSVTYRISLINYEKTFTQDRIKEISDTLVRLAGDNNLTVR